MIVDAHNHLVWPNEPDLEPDILDPRVLLESGVIERAWLLSTGHSIAHSLPDQNDAVLALAKKHPGFFIPFAYLDVEAPPESIDGFGPENAADLAYRVPVGELVLRDLAKTRLFLPATVPSYPIIHGTGWPRAAIDRIVAEARRLGHNGVIWQGTDELVDYRLG